MARKSLMTWVAAGRRWIKKYNGKIYAVSCRQLNVPETKEESVVAANLWWEKKKTEIDTLPPDHSQEESRAKQIWSLVHNWENLDDRKRQEIVDGLLEKGEYQRIKGQVEGTIEQIDQGTPLDRTVGTQVQNWQTLLRSSCQSGQISEGRFDAYCRNIQKFVDWIDTKTDIQQINEQRVEGYFNHLSAQVSNKVYSPTYAHTLLMTAKQFINRLGELKLIEVPSNLRSRRFRFNHSAANKIEVFSVVEVQNLLRAIHSYSEPLELYLLLMLNCGMYQNDIAELRQDEVDWEKGLVSRCRSKTKERQGPTVSYRLWPETFKLLKKYRASKGALALISNQGKPLVRFWLENGKMKRYDLIQSLWGRFAKAPNQSKQRLSLKHLRKTSATILGQHPLYKFYCNHFLADSPKNIADRHYVTPNDTEFFEALAWLRVELLGSLLDQVGE